MSFIALIDCNNFFVSCERLFHPKLQSRPVAVLSNNDGCIIARSQEVKDLGIPMGAPLFEWKELIERKGVYITSSNFTLYADLSYRVMKILEGFTPDVEVYSVDEAFLTLSNPLVASDIKQRIAQWIGIPVSIGVAPTKTLAKVATHIAKKRVDLKGVCSPKKEHWPEILKRFPLQEVWGIGRRLATKLAKKGLYTAAQLCAKEDAWIRKELSIIGLRTVWELRGVPAIKFEEERQKQTITSSRSFGKEVHTLSELHQSIAYHCTKASLRMRQQGSCAHYIQVYLKTKEKGSCTRFCSLPEMTAYTPLLISRAKKATSELFIPGLSYKKAGILLGGLTPKESFQPDLFHTTACSKRSLAQQTMDQLNQSFGQGALFYAAEGIDKPWQARRNFCSPCYTTRWDDLLTIEL